MKRVLLNAALLTAVFVAFWFVFDLDLRSYPSNNPAPSAPLKSTTANTPHEGVHQQWMNEGVALLYQMNRPHAALKKFSQVLSQNPNHYGAQYQRAKALDISGDIGGAISAWQAFEPTAQKTRDTEATAWAKKRITVLTATEKNLATALERGVNHLHIEKKPSSAIPLFQKVLAQWPTHYGAAYQLALALEQDGQISPAQDAWKDVLKRATAIDEQPDMAAAQAALERLGATPATP